MLKKIFVKPFRNFCLFMASVCFLFFLFMKEGDSDQVKFWLSVSFISVVLFALLALGGEKVVKIFLNNN